MIFVAILSLAFALPGAFTAQKSDCKKVSYKKLDLIFLLDGSGSVGHKNFVKTLDFVKNVVGQLPIGASETAVGILQYTQVVEDKDKNRKGITRTEITLNAIHNRDQLIDNIGKIKYVNGATNTDDAISAAYLHFSSHGRENVPKALVVITDGITLMENDLLSKKCQRLRDESGLAIIAVGVGQVEQQGLLAMAGDESNVISIDNFRKMVDFVDRLAMTIQKAIDPSCYSTRELCQRCKKQRCAVNDGDQCTEQFLNCDNMADPVGLTKCPDGHLFAVENLKKSIPIDPAYRKFL
uniref:VWFA domain-containing protein n=1 Tax=Romanomermis culicivorax TaxID=13658 RepID=A0A915KLX8_ROMCU